MPVAEGITYISYPGLFKFPTKLCLNSQHELQILLASCISVGIFIIHLKQNLKSFKKRKCVCAMQFYSSIKSKIIPIAGMKLKSIMLAKLARLRNTNTMFSPIYEIYMIKLKVGFFGERNIQAIIWRYTIILWVWSEYRESICYTCMKIICTIKNI